MYEIEKNVPVPRKLIGPKGIYPILDMAIGDSFAIPFEQIEKARAIRNRVGQVIYYAQRNSTRRFTTRLDPVKQELRVWRVEDRPQAEEDALTDLVVRP